MVTAIVPTLNEAARIGSIVNYLKRRKVVTEILVIDDGSTDDTVEIARACGADVSLSSMLGKGASMVDGLQRAKNDVVLFLDGDIFGFSEELADRMVEPLLADQADFVKGNFRRKAGRVTALTAKPLLKTFFPELAGLRQPLGGIVAGRRQFLKNLRFENDYGVDIGILIDTHLNGGRVAEVDIGTIDHDHQPLEALSTMSFQIVRTILDRAEKYRRLKPANLKDSVERERVAGIQSREILSRIDPSKRLVLFDMDGTLTEGRFIEKLTAAAGRRYRLEGLLGNKKLDPVLRAELIARTLAGIPKTLFETVAAELPLKPGAAETIVSLRQAGFQVGIITDSYFIASEIVRRRTFADFSIAHLLHFSKGHATGRIALSPLMQIEEGCPDHVLCKSNFVNHLRNHFHPTFLPHVSVGNGENDICLFTHSRKGLAVDPETPRVVAGALLQIDNLLETLRHV